MKALTVTQEALLRRNMEFRSLAIRTNGSEVAGGVVGVTCALLGYGVWSLVAQQIVRRLTEVLVLWSVSDWRPCFRFRWTHARELLGFSSGAFLGSVAVFANNRADALLIGLFFGLTATGLYRFGLRLVDVLIGTTVRSLQSVSLPELSRLQDDSAAFVARLGTLVHLGSVVAVPALGILAACAPPLLELLGPEWVPAVTVLQLLCLVGVVRVLSHVVGPMLHALGRPFLQAAVTWSSAAISAGTFVFVGLALAGSPLETQVIGIAASRATIYGVPLLVLTIWLLSRFGGLPSRSFVALSGPSLISGVLAFLCGEAAAAATVSWAPLPQFIVVGAVASAVGGATMWTSDSRVRRHVRVFAAQRQGALDVPGPGRPEVLAATFGEDVSDTCGEDVIGPGQGERPRNLSSSLRHVGVRRSE